MFDQDTLNEAIRRIVEIAEPERIMLFGSAARGDMTRHSDLDLLIIKEGGDALDLMGQIYERLYGVGAAVDNRMPVTGRVCEVAVSSCLEGKNAKSANGHGAAYLGT